jgi:hypothetical protein
MVELVLEKILHYAMGLEIYPSKACCRDILVVDNVYIRSSATRLEDVLTDLNNLVGKQEEDML